MKDILDFEEEIIQPKYAKKSFRSFLYALLGIFVLFFYTLCRILHLEINDIFQIFASFAICSIFVFSFIGIVQSIKSFRRREPNTLKKYVGFIGNLIFILLGISIIIINVIDVLNWINQ